MEYIDEKLQIKLTKLVNLNLDFDKVWDFVNLDLNETYEEYMIQDVKRYIKFLFWLKENNKPTSNSLQNYRRKYKLKSSQEDVSKIMDLPNQLKDRKRIDELSYLMRNKNKKISTQPLSYDEVTRSEKKNINPQSNCLFEKVLKQTMSNINNTEISDLTNNKDDLSSDLLNKNNETKNYETVDFEKEVDDFLTYTLTEETIFEPFIQKINEDEYTTNPTVSTTTITNNKILEETLSDEDIKFVEQSIKEIDEDDLI